MTNEQYKKIIRITDKVTWVLIFWLTLVIIFTISKGWEYLVPVVNGIVLGFLLGDKSSKPLLKATRELGNSYKKSADLWKKTAEEWKGASYEWKNLVRDLVPQDVFIEAEQKAKDRYSKLN